MRTKFLTLCLGATLLLQLQAPAHADGRLYNLQHGAYMLGERKQYAKAIELLKQAQQMDPKDAWTLRQLGDMYGELNRHKESLPYYQEALRLEPSNFRNVDDLTYAMWKLKMYDSLIAFCEPYLKIHGNDKNCADLWERMAHAYAKTSRFKEAYDAYDHYFDFKPGDPDDWWRAADDFCSVPGAPYLNSLFGEYRKRFPRHEGVAALAYDVRKYTQLARADASAGKVDEFESFISYNENKPPVSKSFYGAVKEGLRSVPASIWQPLAGADYTVLLTPRVPDVRIGNDQHPRGYNKGATYANVDALYMPERKAVVIGEMYVNRHGKLVKNEDPSAAVCHELGHAYDDYLGSIYGGAAGDADSADFSHGTLFTAAYKKDVAKLSPSSRSQLQYYLQPADHAGQEELFAELFPIIFNKTDYIGSDDELLRKSFPVTFALMTKLLRVPVKTEAPKTSSAK